MKQDYSHPRPRTSPAEIWGELSKVCQRVHHHLYEDRNQTAAKRYRRRLERIIKKLPENELAILREEALALHHELANDFSAAVPHRQREIELIERLHASVRECVAAGRFDARMGSSVMADWDDGALARRRTILRDLQAQA